MPGSREIYDYGISKNTSGLGKRAIVTEIRVISNNLTAMPELKEVFDRYHFEWMTLCHGYYGLHLTREFYATYVSTLVNSVEEDT